jgi:hypothetical protein
MSEFEPRDDENIEEEMERYRQEVPENLVIALNGVDFELTRQNTSLFTFIGANACKDHVFIVLSDNPDGTCEGTYIFQEFMEQGFIAIENHIIAHDFPQHLNLNEASQVDNDAFERALSSEFSDLTDFIPEDFKLGTEDENGNTAPETKPD